MLVEEPTLPALVPAWPSTVFARVLDRIGKEDALAVIELATDEQLRDVLDRDLWIAAHLDVEETFDVGRFVEWLEVLHEIGPRFAAEKLASMEEDFLAMALRHLVTVIDTDALASVTATFDDDDAAALDDALTRARSEDIDRFQLIAHATEGADAVFGILVALDEVRHDLAETLLARLARISTSRLADGEFEDVLSDLESITEDVRGDRDDRRAAAGHVAPRVARQALELARAAVDPLPRDAIATAHFRSLAPIVAAPPPRALTLPSPRRGSAPSAPRASTRARPRLPDERSDEARRPSLVDIVIEEGLVDRSMPSGTPSALAAAMNGLRAIDAALADQRMEELAYAANVLSSGIRVDGAALSSEAVATLLTELVERAFSLSAVPPIDALRTTPGDALFRVGWRAITRRGARGLSDLARAAVRSTSGRTATSR